MLKVVFFMGGENLEAISHCRLHIKGAGHLKAKNAFFFLPTFC